MKIGIFVLSTFSMWTFKHFQVTGSTDPGHCIGASRSLSAGVPHGSMPLPQKVGHVQLLQSQNSSSWHTNEIIKATTNVTGTNLLAFQKDSELTSTWYNYVQIGTICWVLIHVCTSDSIGYSLFRNWPNFTSSQFGQSQILLFTCSPRRVQRSRDWPHSKTAARHGGLM